MALPVEIEQTVRSTPLLQKAYGFADEAHRGQVQAVNDQPYIEHPAAVASVVRSGGWDDEMVAAALLHDVVEDSETDVAAVRERFGERVAGLVETMTDDREIEPWERRKALHRERVAAAGRDAAAIYAADKLCGVRAMRGGLAREGKAIAKRYRAPLEAKLRVWEQDAAMLDRFDGQIPYLEELDREVSRLREDLTRL
jgi:(p)ppGpp synthase/HD superfamily hydrolase